MKKQSKGITLVALIVTIILLLLLAGITISSLTGSGLFEKAQQAEEKTENVQILENTILSEYEDAIDQYVNKNILETYECITKILENYTVEEIESNKDNVLNQISECLSEASINKLSESEEFMNKLASSQEVMKIFGENAEVRKAIINNDNWSKIIANSEYRSDFSPYLVYNANTLCTTGGGRYYYKTYDGPALSVIFYVKGSDVLLVGKNEDSVKGYCTYNSSYKVTPVEYEYNEEIWYYAQIPYGWADGTKFSSISAGKDVGNVSNIEQAVKLALDDFLGTN